MKNKLSFIIGLIAVVAFSVWYSFTDITHKIYDNNVNTATYSDMGVFTDGQSIQQAFTCEEDELSGFLIKSSPAGDYTNAQITVTVTDPNTGEVVSTGTAVGSSVRARKLNRYEIEPITGCKGKEFVLTVTETNSSAGNGVTFFYQPNEASIGGLLVNENPMAGSLVMKTVTTGFNVETFVVILISLLFIWAFLWFLYRLFK